ncbi:MAG: hypothetical protein KAX84_06025 [Burkholderiales bacterium]|nr:hypothetical protein [Burkholderiales bacterium]
MFILRNACRALAVSVLWIAQSHAATIFNFADFSNCASLQVNGDAACTGGVLRVTPALFDQSGSAFSTALIPLGAGAQFSTSFSFRMTGNDGDDNDGAGADGIVFAVQPVASTVGGSGGGIGYDGIPTSLGVEFDTWNNGPGFGDPDGNHVGIDLNGSIVSVQTVSIPTRMNDGNVWYAWVDYDGSTLEVRLAQANIRPLSPTLSYAVDLASILGTTQAYVGFTSGTGSAWENHDILTWRFDDTFAPIGVAQTVNVPALSGGALLLVALLAAMAGAYAIRRRRA